MATDLIDSYIDREGVRGDTDFLLKQLNKSEQAFQSLHKIASSFSGIQGPKQLANITKEAIEAQTQLEKSTKILIESQQKMTWFMHFCDYCFSYAVYFSLA